MFNRTVCESPVEIDRSKTLTPIELVEDMRDDGRFYRVPTGFVYPSVTTVLKKMSNEGIAAWRERVGDVAADKRMKQASNRGTALHAVCERYLLDGRVDITREIPTSVKMFKQIKPHIDESMGSLYGVEIPLFSDLLMTAGRSDIMAEWDGKPSIIDFKSADKHKPEKYLTGYFYQCTAYGLMAKETYDLDVEQIVIIIGQTDSEKCQVVVKPISKYVKDVKTFFRENSWRCNDAIDMDSKEG